MPEHSHSVFEICLFLQKLSESLASVQRRLEAEWLREFGEEIEVRVERVEA